MRTLAMPKAAEPWSLSSLPEKLIMVGEGRRPRSLRHLPIGRGLGVAADACRNLVANRAPAGAARTSTSGAGVGATDDDETGVRLDAGEEKHFSATVRSTGRLDPAVHAVTDLPLPKTPKGTILSPKSKEYWLHSAREWKKATRFRTSYERETR
jgi:hypothetical protein